MSYKKSASTLLISVKLLFALINSFDESTERVYALLRFLLALGQSLERALRKLAVATLP